MKRKRKIPQGWTKIIFWCCNQCPLEAQQFFIGGGFEVSAVSKLKSFRVKLRKWEAIQLLDMTDKFINSKKFVRNGYQAKER